MAPLLLHGALGKRFGFESFVRDRDAALDRSAVRAGGDPLLGPLDGLQLVTEVIDQGRFDHPGGELAGSVRITRLLALLNSFGAELAGQLTECGFDPPALDRDENARALIVHWGPEPQRSAGRRPTSHQAAGKSAAAARIFRPSPNRNGLTPLAIAPPGPSPVASMSQGTPKA